MTINFGCFKFRNEFPNERIPTLEEIIVECLAHDLTVYIDVKSRAEMVCSNHPSAGSNSFKILNFENNYNASLLLQIVALNDY